MGAVFQADKQLLKFQSKYYETELKRRERILDEAADRGIFLEEESVVSSTTSQWSFQQNAKEGVRESFYCRYMFRLNMFMSFTVKTILCNYYWFLNSLPQHPQDNLECKQNAVFDPFDYAHDKPNTP